MERGEGQLPKLQAGLEWRRARRPGRFLRRPLVRRPQSRRSLWPGDRDPRLGRRRLDGRPGPAAV